MTISLYYNRCYPINDQRKRTSGDLEETFISLIDDGGDNTVNMSNKKEFNILKNQLKEALDTIQILQNIIHEKEICHQDNNNLNPLQIYS